MAEFYKKLFTSFVKTKKVSKNLPKVMSNFSQKCFNQILNNFPTSQMRNDFNQNLTVVVHSHRHNNSSLLEVSMNSKDSEDQSFSELDFSTVREVMYKYSKKA